MVEDSFVYVWYIEYIYICMDTCEREVSYVLCYLRQALSGVYVCIHMREILYVMRCFWAHFIWCICIYTYESEVIRYALFMSDFISCICMRETSYVMRCFWADFVRCVIVCMHMREI